MIYCLYLSRPYDRKWVRARFLATPVRAISPALAGCGANSAATDPNRLGALNFQDGSIFSSRSGYDLDRWLKDNYEDSVKTCSFMHAVDHGFKQAPLEVLSEEDYCIMRDNVSPITQITDSEEIDLVDNLECAGGSCPAK